MRKQIDMMAHLQNTITKEQFVLEDFTSGLFCPQFNNKKIQIRLKAARAEFKAQNINFC